MRLDWGKLVVAAVVAMTVGCDGPDHTSATRALGEPDCTRMTLPWGAGQGQLGVTKGGDEIVPRGPQAAAVGPSGQRLVLDPVNRRLVELKGERAVTIAEVAIDADDLAIGPDGAIAVLSTTRRIVSILEPDGTAAGEVAVPATVRSINGVRLGASRQVSLRTALQETVPLGSPAAPRSLESSLAGTRDGAFTLADGSGLSVRVADGRAELLMTRVGSRDARHRALPGDVSGANLVGVADGVACLRLERALQPAAAIEVHRRALCVDVATGKVLLDRALPAPSTAQPRQELAVGGSPVTLVSLQPRADGMVVETCEVPR